MSGNTLIFDKRKEHLLLLFSASWTQNEHQYTHQEVLAQILAYTPCSKICIKTKEIEWDSFFISLITNIIRFCKEHSITYELLLPEKVDKLLSLLPEEQEVAAISDDASLHPNFIEKIGQKTIKFFHEMSQATVFIGDQILAMCSLSKIKHDFRSKDFWLVMQSVTSNALPIITLVAFLVGTILAYVASVQLRQFGAGIYLANLVGLGMVREMGAVMSAIVMAGRSGAAFAAELGSMKLNKEIAALQVFGFSPNNFLVLPRVICLTLSLPMLTIYSDFIGIFGGGIVSVYTLNTSILQYYNQLIRAITLTDCYTGIIKSFFFGIAIAVVSCFKGMSCAENASAVGKSTTAAVVYSIVTIIVIDAIFTMIFDSLGL